MSTSTLTKSSKLESFKLFYEELPDQSVHPVDEAGEPLAPLKIKRLSRRKR